MLADDVIGRRPPFVRSFVRSIVRSLVRWFVGSLVRWFVRSLVRSLVRSFVGWLVGWFVRSLGVLRIVGWFVRSMVRSFVWLVSWFGWVVRFIAAFGVGWLGEVGRHHHSKRTGRLTGLTFTRSFVG